MVIRRVRRQAGPPMRYFALFVAFSHGICYNSSHYARRNARGRNHFMKHEPTSATAIYGSRGANGVVLITTKRGKGGKVQIDAKVETTYNTRTITPDLIDGYTYASMMNEARTTRNQEPFFPEDKLYILRNGLDQDLYPNVDWMDVLLKKGAPTYRATINMNGGGSLARYYVSASYVDEGGMYKVDKGLKDYNTNANYRRWNYRLNVDMDITKTTLLKVGVSGSLDKKNEPDRKSTRLNSSHIPLSRMPSSA